MSLIPPKKSKEIAEKMLSMLDDANLTIEEANAACSIVSGRIAHAIIKAQNSILFTSKALLGDS